MSGGWLYLLVFSFVTLMIMVVMMSKKNLRVRLLYWRVLLPAHLWDNQRHTGAIKWACVAVMVPDARKHWSGDRTRQWRESSELPKRMQHRKQFDNTSSDLYSRVSITGLTLTSTLITPLHPTEICSKLREDNLVSFQRLGLRPDSQQERKPIPRGLN